MGNEANGFDFLCATNGQSAAQLYGLTNDAALIEYLPGPSLGDLSRNGNDKEAAVKLVNVAKNLHRARPSLSEPAQTVEGWLGALFQVRYGPELTANSQAQFNRAKNLARDLLAAPEETRFLHGDLHHDNIRAADRGYCAFDAKGVLGEREYELANAFRHPKGAEHVVRDANRVRFLRDLWSAEFSVSSHRLMQWVCVKTALSICWRSHSVLGQDQEFDLLEIFLGILDETT